MHDNSRLQQKAHTAGDSRGQWLRRKGIEEAGHFYVCIRGNEERRREEERSSHFATYLAQVLP